MLEWLARSMLVRVQAEHQIADTSGRGDFELFSRFRVKVERHYKEQWQVGQYAGLLRVAPARLNRLCLKLAGKSPFEIAQERLMLEACRKLTYVPARVASIAYELGFQDPAYFSRLFKKLMGVTPKEFRRQAQVKAAEGWRRVGGVNRRSRARTPISTSCRHSGRRKRHAGIRPGAASLRARSRAARPRGCWARCRWRSAIRCGSGRACRSTMRARPAAPR